MSEVATLLRAEIVVDGRTLVGHTMRLSPDRALIRLDEELELDTCVELVLSFRGALAPLRLDGVVEAHRRTAGPGELAGVWLALVEMTATDRAALADLVAEPAISRPLQILVVDDSALTRDVFAHAATTSRCAHLLDGAADVTDAWRRLQAGDYDVLLVDHFLAGASGAELISRMRSDVRLRELPILGMSMGGSVARDAMLSAGVDVFLDKPVRILDVFATLERLALAEGART